MRNLLTPATLALLVAGCVVPQPAAVPYPISPLAAHFVSPEPRLHFQLSRPGYAAVFEIVPGAGARLLYPSPAYGSLSGDLDGGGRVFQGMVYTDAADRSFARADAARAGSSRYLFLIASDRPLQLEELLPNGYVSSVALWDPRFSGGPFHTMERLVRLTVRRTVDDGSWSTDFYADGPPTVSEPHSGQHVVLLCNGHEVVVPEEDAAHVQAELCAGTSSDHAPQESASPAPTVPPRTSRPRPVPSRPDEERGSPERSGQLERPSSRRPGPGPSREPVPAEPKSDEASPPKRASSPKGSLPARSEGGGRRATPASPAEPEGRGNPATPANPATPQKANGRGGRGASAKPADPGDRGKAATPATPAEPKGAGDDKKPAASADPGDRGPQKPSAPADPAKSNGAEGHEKPATPADAGRRGKPETSPAPAKPADPKGAEDRGKAATPAGDRGKPATPADSNAPGKRGAESPVTPR